MSQYAHDSYVEASKAGTELVQGAKDTRLRLNAAKQNVGGMIADALQQASEAMDSNCEFSFKVSELKCKENDGMIKIEVLREGSADSPSVVEWHTEDLSAHAGLDFAGTTNGQLVFNRGETANRGHKVYSGVRGSSQSKSIEIEIYDNEYENPTLHFFVVLTSVGGGMLKGETIGHVEPLKCLVHILDTDGSVLTAILTSAAFQFFSTITTLYALFGTDIALIYVDKKDDDTVGHFTSACFVFFVFEIILTIAVQGSAYTMNVMLYMDLIATLALLPSIPWMLKLLGPAFSSAGSTGTLARAGRAARAGSRAGRAIKVPKLLGQVVGLLAGLASLLPAKESAEEGEETEDDEESMDSPKGSSPKGSSSSRNSKDSKNLKDFDSQEAEAGQASPKAPKPFKKRKKKLKDMTNESHPSIQDAPQVTVPIAPSRIGTIVLEKLTGKLIVMMMLLLLINTILFEPPYSSQKLQGLMQLEAVYKQCGNNFEHDAFKGSLAEELLYLKIANQLVPKLKYDETSGDWVQPLEYEYSDDGAALYYDQQNKYESLREASMSFEGPNCSPTFLEAVDDLISDECNLAVIFDNEKNSISEAENNMWLTVCIVGVLGVGMGLVASDLHSCILCHIERLTSVVRGVFEVKNVLFPAEGDNEQTSNPVRRAHRTARRWDHALEVMLETAPPSEPLKMPMEILTDVETALSLSFHGVRRTILRAQDSLKAPMGALEETFHKAKDGSLTLENFLVQVKTASVADDGTPVYLKLPVNPEMKVFLSLFVPKLAMSVENSLLNTNRTVASEARKIGLNVPIDGDLTISDAQKVFLHWAKEKFTVFCAALQIEQPPSEEIESLDLEELYDLCEELILGKIREELLLPLGIELPPGLESEGAHTFTMVAREATVRHSLHKLPTALRKEVKVDKKTSLNDLRKEIIKGVKRSTFSALKPFAMVHGSEDNYTAMELLLLLRSSLTEIFGKSNAASMDLRHALAASKRLMDVLQMSHTELPYLMRMMSGTAVTPASTEPVNVGALKATLKDIGYPEVFFPFLNGQKLPSAEQLLENPEELGAELIQTLIKIDLGGQLSKMSTGTAVDLREKLTSFLHASAVLSSSNVDTLTATEMLKLLKELGYPDTVKVMNPDLVLPSAEEVMASEEQELRALLKQIAPATEVLRGILKNVPEILLNGSEGILRDVLPDVGLEGNAIFSAAQGLVLKNLPSILASLNIEIELPNGKGPLQSRDALKTVLSAVEKFVHKNVDEDTVKASGLSTVFTIIQEQAAKEDFSSGDVIQILQTLPVTLASGFMEKGWAVAAEAVKSQLVSQGFEIPSGVNMDAGPLALWEGVQNSVKSEAVLFLRQTGIPLPNRIEDLLSLPSAASLLMFTLKSAISLNFRELSAIQVLLDKLPNSDEDVLELSPDRILSLVAQFEQFLQNSSLPKEVFDFFPALQSLPAEELGPQLVKFLPMMRMALGLKTFMFLRALQNTQPAVHQLLSASLDTMPKESLIDLLERVGYPNTLSALLPVGTILPSINEMKSLERNEMLGVVRQLKNVLSSPQYGQLVINLRQQLSRISESFAIVPDLTDAHLALPGLLAQAKGVVSAMDISTASAAEILNVLQRYRLLELLGQLPDAPLLPSFDKLSQASTTEILRVFAEVKDILSSPESLLAVDIMPMSLLGSNLQVQTSKVQQKILDFVGSPVFSALSSVSSLLEMFSLSKPQDIAKMALAAAAKRAQDSGFVPPDFPISPPPAKPGLHQGIFFSNETKEAATLIEMPPLPNIVPSDHEEQMNLQPNSGQETQIRKVAALYSSVG
eukprot:gene5915-7117_t